MAEPTIRILEQREEGIAPVVLHARTEIEFTTPSGDALRVRLDEQGRLVVTGDGRLVVEPRAANRLHITSA